MFHAEFIVKINNKKRALRVTARGDAGPPRVILERKEESLGGVNGDSRGSAPEIQ